MRCAEAPTEMRGSKIGKCVGARNNPLKVFPIFIIATIYQAATMCFYDLLELCEKMKKKKRNKVYTDTRRTLHIRGEALCVYIVYIHYTHKLYTQVTTSVCIHSVNF